MPFIKVHKVFMSRQNTKYTAEFKILVIKDMLENRLSYSDTVKKYWTDGSKSEWSNHRAKLRSWERIYLEEGEEGLAKERRGRNTKMESPNKGRPRKKPLSEEIQNDLIAEIQRLKEQNEYLQRQIDYLKSKDA